MLSLTNQLTEEGYHFPVHSIQLSMLQPASNDKATLHLALGQIRAYLDVTTKVGPLKKRVHLR